MQWLPSNILSVWYENIEKSLKRKSAEVKEKERKSIVLL